MQLFPIMALGFLASFHHHKTYLLRRGSHPQAVVILRDKTLQDEGGVRPQTQAGITYSTSSIYSVIGSCFQAAL
jgi:hypothetical protein